MSCPTIRFSTQTSPYCDLRRETTVDGVTYAIETYSSRDGRHYRVERDGQLIDQLSTLNAARSLVEHLVRRQPLEQKALAWAEKLVAALKARGAGSGVGAWDAARVQELAWGDAFTRQGVLAAVCLEGSSLDACELTGGSYKWLPWKEPEGLLAEPYSSWLIYIYEA